MKSISSPHSVKPVKLFFSELSLGHSHSHSGMTAVLEHISLIVSFPDIFLHLLLLIRHPAIRLH